MTDSKTDLELINEFQGGNSTSFEELIARYSTKAFCLARRLTKSEQDAEEVLQDVFVTVYRKIGGFEGKSSFSSWLYRVTVNASLMKLRRRRTNRSVAIEDTQLEVDNHVARTSIEKDEADQMAMRGQLTAVLERAILRLPDEYRPVFVLRDIDGLTSREVGKILQLSIPAVKSRLHRSRSILRRRLAPYYRDYCGVADMLKVGNGGGE